MGVGVSIEQCLHSGGTEVTLPITRPHLTVTETADGFCNGDVILGAPVSMRLEPSHLDALGILDLGLQIRRRGASSTGTMFGNGIYLADVSSKSAAYCKHELWGGEVVLQCEADIGARRIRSLTSISDGHEAIEKSGGRQRCIKGVGRVRPSKWKIVRWEIGGLPRKGEETVLMPDTTVPYSDTFSGGSLAFNEYVLYPMSAHNPAQP